MALDQITLTGTYLSPKNQEPMSGKVSFTLNATIQEAVSDTIIARKVQEVVLDVNGQFSITLVANTDPDAIPANTAYLVNELLDDTEPRQYLIVIPADAPGGTIDLADLTPATELPSIYNYALVGHTHDDDFSDIFVGIPTYTADEAAEAAAAAVQDGRLDALETNDAAQDAAITSNDNDIAALQAADTALDGRVTDIEDGTTDLSAFVDHGSLAGLSDFTPDHGAGHDAHDHSTALGTASIADLQAKNAADVDYSNATSGLVATDVQAAIDEIDATVAGAGQSNYTEIVSRVFIPGSMRAFTLANFIMPFTDFKLKRLQGHFNDTPSTVDASNYWKLNVTDGTTSHDLKLDDNVANHEDNVYSNVEQASFFHATTRINAGIVAPADMVVLKFTAGVSFTLGAVEYEPFESGATTVSAILADASGNILVEGPQHAFTATSTVEEIVPITEYPIVSGQTYHIALRMITKPGANWRVALDNNATTPVNISSVSGGRGTYPDLINLTNTGDLPHFKLYDITYPEFSDLNKEITLSLSEVGDAGTEPGADLNVTLVVEEL